jgi:hypothetical protein
MLKILRKVIIDKNIIKADFLFLVEILAKN